ncbi:MAG: aminoacyl-tRNA hydrolase [Desulfobulbaceae bacterium]
MSAEQVLIVGLGNPGDKYERTRHNAGFIALNYLAAGLGVEIGSEKMQGRYCATRLNGNKLFLLKPMTYMNRSGECVRSFAGYFDISPERILVVHDDLDLPPGRIKMVRRGGAGGHNGIRSLMEHLNTQDFPRLKIGIGHPRDHEDTRSIPVERYVLAAFTPDEYALFQDRLPLVEEGITLFVKEGISAAMNRVNRGVSEAS